MRAFWPGARVADERRSGGAEHGRTIGWVKVFLPFALGYYLSYLLRTVNAVISPRLTDELGLSAASLGLLTSAYFLAFGAAQIPVGIALDRFTRRGQRSGRTSGRLCAATDAGRSGQQASARLRDHSADSS